MKTAIFLGIDQEPKSTVVFADAQAHGETISGVGFSYDDGKYDAMWDLAKRLTDRGIELEAS